MSNDAHNPCWTDISKLQLKKVFFLGIHYRVYRMNAPVQRSSFFVHS